MAIESIEGNDFGWKLSLHIDTLSDGKWSIIGNFPLQHLIADIFLQSWSNVISLPMWFGMVQKRMAQRIATGS